MTSYPLTFSLGETASQLTFRVLAFTKPAVKPVMAEEKNENEGSNPKNTFRTWQHCTSRLADYLHMLTIHLNLGTVFSALFASPCVFKCTKFPTRNYLFFTGDWAALIFRTRLRLNFSAFNYDLFKRNCSISSACTLWCTYIEDVKHYFLFCPSFAVLREILFASAVHLLWVFYLPIKPFFSTVI